jgi:hypothetical protein
MAICTAASKDALVTATAAYAAYAAVLVVFVGIALIRG